VPLSQTIASVTRLFAALLVVAVLSGCSDSKQDDERSAEAAVLADKFDATWMPVDAQLWEALTAAEPCRTDCWPVAVSFTYFCPCDDLNDEMADVQERVRSSGFEIVEPYSSESGGFEAQMAAPELPSGLVQMRAYGTPDAREVQPLNTALATEADGRAAINISLVAADD